MREDIGWGEAIMAELRPYINQLDGSFTWAVYVYPDERMVVGEVSLRTIAKESYGRWSRYINELFHECFDRHFSGWQKIYKGELR